MIPSKETIDRLINSVPDSAIEIFGELNDNYNKISSCRCADFFLRGFEDDEVVDANEWLVTCVIDRMILKSDEGVERWMEQVIREKQDKGYGDFTFIRKRMRKYMGNEKFWIITVILDIVSEITEPHDFPNVCSWLLFLNYYNILDKINDKRKYENENNHTETTEKGS
jgi:hypothetical protein